MLGLWPEPPLVTRGGFAKAYSVATRCTSAAHKHDTSVPTISLADFVDQQQTDGGRHNTREECVLQQRTRHGNNNNMMYMSNNKVQFTRAG